VKLTATRLDLCAEHTFNLTCCLSDILTGIKELLAELKLAELKLAAPVLALAPAGPAWSRAELKEAGPESWVGTCWERCQLEEKAIKGIRFEISLLEPFLLGCSPSDLKRSCLDQKESKWLTKPRPVAEEKFCIHWWRLKRRLKRSKNNLANFILILMQAQDMLSSSRKTKFLLSFTKRQELRLIEMSLIMRSF